MRQQPRRWAKKLGSLVRLHGEYLRLRETTIPICDGTANFWDGKATKPSTDYGD
jgi:hypothetical protein